MSGTRRFVRYRVNAKCALDHNNITYLGQLENLSLGGALLSFDDGVVIPREDQCNLIIYLENESSPLNLSVVVIHSNFTMVGVKFITDDNETIGMIENFLQRMFGANNASPGENPGVL